MRVTPLPFSESHQDKPPFDSVNTNPPARHYYTPGGFFVSFFACFTAFKFEA